MTTAVVTLVFLILLWGVFSRILEDRRRDRWVGVALEEKDREILRLQEDVAFFRGAVEEQGLKEREICMRSRESSTARS